MVESYQDGLEGVENVSLIIVWEEKEGFFTVRNVDQIALDVACFGRLEPILTVY